MRYTLDLTPAAFEGVDVMLHESQVKCISIFIMSLASQVKSSLYRISLEGGKLRTATPWGYQARSTRLVRLLDRDVAVILMMMMIVLIAAAPPIVRCCCRAARRSGPS